MKIYYIHGYGSNGVRSKENLKNALGLEVEILGWDYKRCFRENFSDLLEKVKEIFTKESEILIVASSLGCYYARAIGENVPSCKLRLFNPCFKPRNSSVIEPQISLTYDYKFNATQKIDMSIFVSDIDEVIPNNDKIVKEMFGKIAKIEITKEKHKIESFEKYKDKILL